MTLTKNALFLNILYIHTCMQSSIQPSLLHSDLSVSLSSSSERRFEFRMGECRAFRHFRLRLKPTKQAVTIYNKQQLVDVAAPVLAQPEIISDMSRHDRVMIPRRNTSENNFFPGRVYLYVQSGIKLLRLIKLCFTFNCITIQKRTQKKETAKRKRRHVKE